MDRISKLDSVLEWMYLNNKPSHSKDICENANIKVSDNEAYKILCKLSKDGYADVVNNIWVFEINYNGIIFFESGGYKAEIQDLKSRRNLHDRINKIVALGTFLAGIYALIETLKFLLNIFYC